MRRYRKSNYRRKRTYRRKTKKGTNWAGLAKKAFKTAKWVAGLVNAEYKYFDVNILPASHNYNGTVTSALCVPAQGTAAQDRTGDSIKMKNLTMRGEWLLNAAGAAQETVRIIIFIDKQNNITSGAQLLQAVGNANAVYSPKSNDNRYDTKFIIDKTYVLDSDNPIKKLDWVIKLNLHQHFNTGTTTVDTNAIKIALFTQSATNGAQFQYYSRVTYMDN